METTLLTAYAVTLAPHPSTRGWAIAWLSGTDRSADAATRAAASAEVFVHASGCAGMDNPTANGARLAAEMAAGLHDLADDGDRFRSLIERYSGCWPDECALRLARAAAILAGEFPADQFDSRY